MFVNIVEYCGLNFALQEKPPANMKALVSRKEAKIRGALRLSSPDEGREECGCSAPAVAERERSLAVADLSSRWREYFCLLVSVCVLRGCPAELIYVVSCHPFKMAFQTAILSTHENTLKLRRKMARIAARCGLTGPVVFHCRLPRPRSLCFD